MMQLALFGGPAELGPALPRCAWRGCLESAAHSLGFGRLRGALLFADYCGVHAEATRRLFRVETCTRTRSPDFTPADAHAREAQSGVFSPVLRSV